MASQMADCQQDTVSVTVTRGTTVQGQRLHGDV